MVEIINEFEEILLALLVLLVSLPFLVWIIFNRWQVWTKLLGGQLGKLVQEVDDLRSQSRCSPEIIGELDAYIETVHRIVNDQRRSSRFLPINKTNDLSTITNITREMVKTIRGSAEPEGNVSSYLETRRKTIALLFDRMVGR